MLVEIQCDKFIKHGEIRKPIQFHAGLNTVIGDDNGYNLSLIHICRKASRLSSGKTARELPKQPE